MDSPAIARKKHSCSACGAEANWNPAKQALVCLFCGTTTPRRLEPDTLYDSSIAEHDLVTALRNISDDQRGWRAQKTSVKCQSCQAISVFDAARVGQRCDFCGSSALVPYEEIKEVFTPESLLPFKVSATQVRELIRQWYGTVWFAPNKLKQVALTDQVHGVYVPYWTFDAQVSARWTAASGYYYYTTERVRAADGRTTVRQVRHTRWQPSAGALQHFFDDALVPASRGVHLNYLRAVEPFPTAELVPYAPGYLAGWVVERYQLDLVAATRQARKRMDSALRKLCGAQVPGDTYRDLRVTADYTGQTFKHVLLPIWLLSFSYGARTFQVVGNGYTGSIAGEYPKSWVKIVCAVLVAITIFLLVFLAQN